MQNAATRSPSRTGAPSGALRTTPPTSLPGTNGRSGLTWYSPRVWSTSGNETPAACTSTTTPPSGAIMCAGPGSGRSTSLSAESGPVSSAIWIALIGGNLVGRAGRALRGLAAGVPQRVEQGLAGAGDGWQQRQEAAQTVAQPRGELRALAAARAGEALLQPAEQRERDLVRAVAAQRPARRSALDGGAELHQPGLLVARRTRVPALAAREDADVAAGAPAELGGDRGEHEGM